MTLYNPTDPTDLRILAGKIVLTDANGFPVPVDQVSGNGGGVQLAVPAGSVIVATNIPQSTNIDDSMAGGGLNRWSYVGTWGANNAAMTNEYNRSTTFSDNANDTASVTFFGTGPMCRLIDSRR